MTRLSRLLAFGRAEVARRATGSRHAGDAWADLPPRLPLHVWIGTLVAFLAVYLFMFTHVHVVADTRVCMLRLPDPLHDLLPVDRRWLFVTVDVYTGLTLAAIAVLFTQAYLGDHRPIVRWGAGLALCGSVRAVTILLVPLCHALTATGTAPLASVPTLHLGPLAIPWRMFAVNDLLFSGHVCELVILIRATRSWPRDARAVLWAYQVLQIAGLLIGRGHYTIDIVLAFPIAVWADHAAHAVVRWAVRT